MQSKCKRNCKNKNVLNAFRELTTSAAAVGLVVILMILGMAFISSLENFV